LSFTWWETRDGRAVASRYRREKRNTITRLSRAGGGGREDLFNKIRSKRWGHPIFLLLARRAEGSWFRPSPIRGKEIGGAVMRLFMTEEV